MTENKRFTFHLDKRNPYKWNVFYGEKFVCQNNYKKGAENICDLLNDFAEENEQLKQLLDYADDIIKTRTNQDVVRQWENIKGDVE